VLEEACQCIVQRRRNRVNHLSLVVRKFDNEKRLNVGFVIAALVVAYFVGARIVAHRYYARRHGIAYQKGGTGTVYAAQIGIFWPVTMLIPSVQHPTMCAHTKHVLEAERLREELRQAQEIRRQRGRATR
jgi:uncharacterized protein YqgC (DUF456 family)